MRKHKELWVNVMAKPNLSKAKLNGVLLAISGGNRIFILFTAVVTSKKEARLI